MAIDIEIPNLGMATAEATIIEWTVKEGEQVAENQAVTVVEVDKIRSDVEAAAAGFVHILAGEGSTTSVGAVIGVIADSREELETLQKKRPEEAPAEARETIKTSGPVTTTDGDEGRIRISPVARKMAEEHALDITGIKGTGPEGRITREDIEKAIAGKGTVVTEAYAGKKVKTVIPLKGMRKSIAGHMQRSLAISAQLTTMGEIDMTAVIKMREELLRQESALGIRVTYTDILVLTLAMALKDNPVINASLIDDEIKVWEDINIGVAVALDDGLIVPVVKDADKKLLVEISKTVKSLTGKARSAALTTEDITGGTFTLTNLGALGGGWNFETAIINQPESAILRTGSIVDRAVVRDGQIVIRPIMTYSLTYDHRVIDGAVAAGFMTSLINLLENPDKLG
ncbi:dihydrolipoamide acetyltransferase family protein [Chloroflexota bacterium]